jgi:hypothetical protein
MKKLIALAITAALPAPSIVLASVNSKGAAYFGGTAGFKNAKDPVDGVLDTKNDLTLIFSATEKPFKGQTLSIPYKEMIDLEYGQKAGRRVGAAVGYTILLGPLGLLTLFSKKRIGEQWFTHDTKARSLENPGFN